MSDGLISVPSDLNKCHQDNLKQLFKQLFRKLVAEVISNLFWLLWKKIVLFQQEVLGITFNNIWQDRYQG